MLNEIISQYKNMINFGDKDEKNNYKWVTTYVATEQKNGTSTDVQLVAFVKDAIDIQKRYMNRGEYLS